MPQDVEEDDERSPSRRRSRSSSGRRSSVGSHSSMAKTYRNIYIYLSVASIVSLFFLYYAYLAGSRINDPEHVSESCSRDNVSVFDWNNSKNSDGDYEEGLKLGARPFKILFWTKWYGHYADQSGEFVKPECKDEFVVTSNKSECGDADVIIFQYVDIFRIGELRLPPNRDNDVPWILSLQEASIQHPIQGNATRFNGIFNWTWSLRSDSLIHPNFTEMFEKCDEPDQRWIYGSDFSKEFLRQKTNSAAWVVSNCRVVLSKREELVDKLADLGIKIDIYGKCGNHTCETGDKCFSTLGLSYKFYFAFENSLCEDYITEKIYHGLLHGMVPVVYALGNVGMNAPPNSFINVLDFPNVSDLAKRLTYLDENPQEYFKYLEWRQYFNVNVTGSPRYQCYTWRKMKEYTLKLRSDEDFKFRHVYENFNDWFTKSYNHRLGKMCLTCLDLESIDTADLSGNIDRMYNDASRCL